MTNYDWIKSLPPDKLAEQLLYRFCKDRVCPDHKNCELCALDWLKEENEPEQEDIYVLGINCIYKLKAGCSPEKLVKEMNDSIEWGNDHYFHLDNSKIYNYTVISALGGEEETKLIEKWLDEHGYTKAEVGNGEQERIGGKTVHAVQKK